jgi:hypothetical protein
MTAFTGESVVGWEKGQGIWELFEPGVGSWELGARIEGSRRQPPGQVAEKGHGANESPSSAGEAEPI